MKNSIVLGLLLIFITACSNSGSGNSSKETMLEADDYSETALNDPPPHNLKLSTNDRGEIESDSTEYPCAGGTCYFDISNVEKLETFTATPHAGFAFAGWKGYCQHNTGSCKMLLSTETQTLEAIFVPEEELPDLLSYPAPPKAWSSDESNAKLAVIDEVEGSIYHKSFMRIYLGGSVHQWTISKFVPDDASFTKYFSQAPYKVYDSISSHSERYGYESYTVTTLQEHNTGEVLSLIYSNIPRTYAFSKKQDPGQTGIEEKSDAPEDLHLNINFHQHNHSGLYLEYIDGYNGPTTQTPLLISSRQNPVIADMVLKVYDTQLSTHQSGTQEAEEYFDFSGLLVLDPGGQGFVLRDTVPISFQRPYRSTDNDSIQSIEIIHLSDGTEATLYSLSGLYEQQHFELIASLPDATRPNGKNILNGILTEGADPKNGESWTLAEKPYPQLTKQF